MASPCDCSRLDLFSPHSTFARTEFAVYLGRSGNVKIIARWSGERCSPAHGNVVGLARRESHPVRGVRVDLALPRSVDEGREGGRTDGGAGLRIFSSPLLPDAKNVTVPHRSLRRCASSISSSAMQRRQRRRHGRVLKVQCQRRRLSLGATMMGRDRRRRIRGRFCRRRR